MRLYDSPEIFERPPERVATVYQSSFPLLSSKMAYLCAPWVPIFCIQKQCSIRDAEGPARPVDVQGRPKRSGEEMSSGHFLGSNPVASIFYARKLLINKRFPGFFGNSHSVMVIDFGDYPGGSFRTKSRTAAYEVMHMRRSQ